MEAQKHTSIKYNRSKWFRVFTRFSIIGGLCLSGYFLSYSLFVNPLFRNIYFSNEYFQIIINEFMHIFNILINAGSLLGGISLIIIALVAWLMSFLTHRIIILIASSGILFLIGAIGETATGVIPVFMNILAGIMLVVTFFSLAMNVVKSGKLNTIIKKN
jgi:hypothetical protein